MGPAGRYAEREMRAALARLAMTPPPGAVARYAHAADRLAVLRKAWEDAGSPATATATATGSRDQIIAHPLLAELRLSYEVAPDDPRPTASDTAKGGQAQRPTA